MIWLFGIGCLHCLLRTSVGKALYNKAPSELGRVTVVVVADRASAPHLAAAQCTWLTAFNPLQVVHVTDFEIPRRGGCGFEVANQLALPHAGSDYIGVFRALNEQKTPLLRWVLIVRPWTFVHAPNLNAYLKAAGEQSSEVVVGRVRTAASDWSALGLMPHASHEHGILMTAWAASSVGRAASSCTQLTRPSPSSSSSSSSPSKRVTARCATFPLSANTNKKTKPPISSASASAGSSSSGGGTAGGFVALSSLEAQASDVAAHLFAVTSVPGATVSRAMLNVLPVPRPSLFLACDPSLQSALHGSPEAASPLLVTEGPRASPRTNASQAEAGHNRDDGDDDASEGQQQVEEEALPSCDPEANPGARNALTLGPLWADPGQSSHVLFHRFGLDAHRYNGSVAAAAAAVGRADTASHGVPAPESLRQPRKPASAVEASLVGGSNSGELLPGSTAAASADTEVVEEEEEEEEEEEDGAGRRSEHGGESVEEIGEEGEEGEETAVNEKEEEEEEMVLEDAEEGEEALLGRSYQRRRRATSISGNQKGDTA